MTQYRVLIVDDEPLARAKLHRLVAVHPRLSEAGVATTGTEAVNQIEQLRPDIVFLDIQMPGLSGIQVVQQIKARPHIIFTTAYDEFAVTAFELQAVDYLLKPFGKKRFDLGVERILQFESASLERLQKSLSSSTIDRLFIRERNRTKAVDVSEILQIKGAGDYVEIITQSASHLMAVRMKQLESRLDNTFFIRIHRSTIVNINHVSEIQAVGNGRYEVTMRDGSISMTSRSGAATLKAAFKNL